MLRNDSACPAVFESADGYSVDETEPPANALAGTSNSNNRAADNSSDERDRIPSTPLGPARRGESMNRSDPRPLPGSELDARGSAHLLRVG